MSHHENTIQIDCGHACRRIHPQCVLLSDTQSFGKPGYNPQRTSKDDTKPMNRNSSDTARITGTKPGSENQSR